MKAFVHSVTSFIQRNSEEIGTGGLGFFISKYFDSVILPLLVAAGCALVSSIVKDWYQRRKVKRDQTFFKQNGRK
jgi:hypothetical protein